jgi:hypothetical protein
MITVCEKIDAFERHVLERQLRIGQILAAHFLKDTPGDKLSESAFVILAVGLAYFEMIEQFITGESSEHHSAEFFGRGFERVYGNAVVAASDIARVYRFMRCGMYHAAMPKDRCGLSRHLPRAFDNENGVIVINPAILIGDLINHFSKVCAELRDGRHCELQRNFESMFDTIGSSAPTRSQAKTPSTQAPWDVT